MVRITMVRITMVRITEGYDLLYSTTCLGVQSILPREFAENGGDEGNSKFY